MTLQGLGKALRDMYSQAPKGEKSTAIHLFGIKYADEIPGHGAKAIAVQAGIEPSYGTEILKGVRLARHVDLRNR